MIDVLHGAVASLSLVLGVGVTALFMTAAYFMLSGRWPWQ